MPKDAVLAYAWFATKWLIPVNTRESARQIIERHLRRSGETEARIRNLLDAADPAFWRLPLRLGRLYRPEGEPIHLDRCWIAYLEYPGQELCLRSSTVVLVYKDTGKVVYHGSADDDG